MPFEVAFKGPPKNTAASRGEASPPGFVGAGWRPRAGTRSYRKKEDTAAFRPVEEPGRGHVFGDVAVYPREDGGQTRGGHKLVLAPTGALYEQEAARASADAWLSGGSPSVEAVAAPAPRASALLAPAVDGPQLAPDIEARVGALRGRGDPLPVEERANAERVMGFDLGLVRLHTGAEGARVSEALGARAFTVGSDIFFGSGEYRPDIPSGLSLVAHELVHVAQQRAGVEAVQRQPADTKADDFDFMLAQLQGGEHVVVDIVSPRDPAEFLEMWKGKAQQLFEAEERWLTRNMFEFLSDTVLKADKAPFPGMNRNTVEAVGKEAFGNLVSGLAVGKAAGGIGRDIIRVINIGTTAAAGVSGFGALLKFFGGALVEAYVGSLFDKEDEIVRQKSKEVTARLQTFVYESVIPLVRANTRILDSFVAGLSEYVVGGKAAKGKGGDRGTGVSSEKFGVGIDTSLPLTEERVRWLMLELANTVLDIDASIRNLKGDLSLYHDLALRAGVFSGKEVPARPAADAATRSLDKNFTVKHSLPKGEARVRVPANWGVEITSVASYDADTSGLSSGIVPPPEYEISLHRDRDGAVVSVPRRYRVGEVSAARWYNLEEGWYYLSIRRYGNPNIALSGSLEMVARSPAPPATEGRAP